MMKYLMLCIALCSVATQAQDFDKVEAVVSLYPSKFDNASELASLISRDFNDPIEKVRAGYTWLIYNVAYEPQEYYNFKFQYRILEERNQKAAASREGMIKRTVQNGQAVCEGYALVLERLCELWEINSYVVRGDIKTIPQDIGRPFKKSHMWNVVVIAQKPYLIDATWGAGRYVGKFIKEPSYFYFDTSPELFVRDHFPEVFEDTYLDEKMSREAFAQRPLLVDKALSLNAVTPTYGILKAKNLKKGIVFSLPITENDKVTYTLNNGTQWPVERLSAQEFTVQEREKTTGLVLYVNGKPAIGYKIR